MDGDFKQVHGEILHKDPVLDLEECYALVRWEAIHHATLKGESDNPETSAIIAR